MYITWVMLIKVLVSHPPILFIPGCGWCRLLHVRCSHESWSLSLSCNAVFSGISSKYVSLDHWCNCIPEGPERELLQLAVFGELQALFPGVKVYIDLVGPEIPHARSGLNCIYFRLAFAWLWLKVMQWFFKANSGLEYSHSKMLFHTFLLGDSSFWPWKMLHDAYCLRFQLSRY